MPVSCILMGSFIPVELTEILIQNIESLSVFVDIKIGSYLQFVPGLNKILYFNKNLNSPDYA